MEIIDFLQKVKHIRPTTEKIYNSIRKELSDELDIVKCETNIDYLIDNGIVEGRGAVEQESVFIVEWAEESSEESGEKTILETNIQTEIQMIQKEEGNTEIMLGNFRILYERLISNLKSEINFLKNQLLAKDTFYREDITFLRRQLSDALVKKVDHSAYLSSDTVAVNADQPPVNEDLADPKPEKIRSESKKNNTKEKSNTETNINSNVNNYVESKIRDTEKKSESDSRMI